jgi:hypothetical protein
MGREVEGTVSVFLNHESHESNESPRIGFLVSAVHVARSALECGSPLPPLKASLLAAVATTTRDKKCTLRSEMRCRAARVSERPSVQERRHSCRRTHANTIHGGKSAAAP